jgi:hypothetical protein
VLASATRDEKHPCPVCGAIAARGLANPVIRLDPGAQ